MLPGRREGAPHGTKADAGHSPMHTCRLSRCAIGFHQQCLIGVTKEQMAGHSTVGIQSPLAAAGSDLITSAKAAFLGSLLFWLLQDIDTIVGSLFAFGCSRILSHVVRRQV